MNGPALLVIAEAEDGLAFFQSFVVTLDASGDHTAATRRVAEYLRRQGASLRRIAREDVTEIDFARVPAAWLAKASPSDGILACGGRAWVDPQLPEEPAERFTLTRRLCAAFERIRKAVGS